LFEPNRITQVCDKNLSLSLLGEGFEFFNSSGSQRKSGATLMQFFCDGLTKASARTSQEHIMTINIHVRTVARGPT
jgi:phosphotransferase system IIA component